MKRTRRQTRFQRYAAEAAGTAIVAGWALFVVGVAALTNWWVCALGTGVLLMSGAGWKLIWILAREGLYALSQEEQTNDHGHRDAQAARR